MRNRSLLYEFNPGDVARWKFYLPSWNYNVSFRIWQALLDALFMKEHMLLRFQLCLHSCKCLRLCSHFGQYGMLRPVRHKVDVTLMLTYDTPSTDELGLGRYNRLGLRWSSRLEFDRTSGFIHCGWSRFNCKLVSCLTQTFGIYVFYPTLNRPYWLRTTDFTDTSKRFKPNDVLYKCWTLLTYMSETMQITTID